MIECLSVTGTVLGAGDPDGLKVFGSIFPCFFPIIFKMQGISKGKQNYFQMYIKKCKEKVIKIFITFSL